MRSVLFQHFFTACVLLICYAVGFEFPLSYSTDVAIISNLDVTSNCADGGTYSCNSKCPNREDFPTLNVLITTVSSLCKTTPAGSVQMPPAANVSNGQIFFDNSTTGCNAISHTFSSVSHFTLSMWIKASCISQTCNIFNIGDGLTMTFSGKELQLNTVPAMAKNEAWHHIAIRYNGKFSWFLNGQQITTVSATSSSLVQMTIGPKTNLFSGDYIHFLDVRWYQDALTDRELTYLYNKSFLDVKIKTNCRCPGTHPTLVEETGYAKYTECTNGSTKVLRLGSNAYLPEYMLDRDTKTSWISGNVREANITLTLRKQFQLKSITLTGVKNQPSDMKITLSRSGTQTNVISISSSGGEIFTYNFEQPPISTRSAYQKLVANKVIIQAKFTANNHFTVNELKLEARCACYGNDKACSINTGGTYKCSCDAVTHTTHEYCLDCQPEYYRKSEEFGCTSPCNCNTTGSLDNICEQIGGQCKCRQNIDKIKCSECIHNTANFGNIGCTECPCNPDGITSCSDGLICNCKENVDNSTGRCDSCLQNYYNIRQPTGCTACNCDARGTRNIQSKCDKRNGQCYCKAYVLGRTCNMCKDRFYGLTAENKMGCSACECNIVGSVRLECNKATGYCPCVDGKIHDNNTKCVPGNLHLDPTFGPVAGGTLLTLTGTLLGTDNNVRLSIDGSEQTIWSRNLSMVIFESKKGKEGVKELSLKWTRENLTYPAFNITFEYKKNPQMIVPTTNIRSFASGGCTLRMQGSNLDSVPYPKMLVHLQDNANVDSPCTAEDDGFLRCPTPNMSNYNTDSQYTFGFKLDGQDIYENISAKYGAMLTVVSDPFVYSGMTETFRNTFDKTFKIKGERLNEACHDGDITIMLGDKDCPILSRTQDSISCNPGEEFPGNARTVEVKVKIGNFQKVWGKLEINSFWTNTEFIYIAVGAGVFLLLLVALIICIVKCRRRDSYDRYSESSPSTDNLSLEQLSSGTKTAKPNDYEKNPVAVIPPLENKMAERTSKEIADDFCNRLKKTVGKIVKTSLIERSNIDLKNICTHKGKKIRVINGQYNASTSSPHSGSSVTIKTLLEHYQEEGELPEWLNNGLQECTRLQDFVHDNVLRMKGIALDAKNIYIIYPEMSNRTLKDYLLNVRQSLTDEKKLEICIQVSEGMNYLSTSGVVHKDLAARNCWVSDDFEVKISDASFSYDIYPEEYLENNGKYQPVRWMAPESLRQGFYDTKTDVWSFGVVVWEVFANGSLPYHDVKNEDIRKKVCDEQCRLWKPAGCSDAIFGLIQECHTNRSEDRPNFYIIQNRLDNIVNPPEDQPLYENQEFKTVTGEQDLEDYVNTAFVMTPPKRPPRRP